MPQLDPTWFASQLFWLAVCFTLLYVLLARVILPPLGRTIMRRSHTISSDFEAAESAKNLAERAKQDYDHTLLQSREMAQGLIHEVLEDNAMHAEQTLRALDVETNKKIQEATARINNKKLELLTALTPTAAEFAAMISEKITSKPANPEQASQVVMDLLKARGL
ncbi:MAG: hypothetical protein SFX19_03415 [Alphaproteobacteria bacterium]|nr:hypothetical protein [Alphaproteobacteria bacterium]